MSQHIQKLSSSQQTVLIGAMEANQAEEMACIARSLPEGEVHEDAEIRWFFTGRPGFNGILHTCINSTEKTYIDARISATLAHFQQRNVSIGWPIGPQTQPSDLATHLQAHGLTYRSTHQVMTLDISRAQNHTTTQVPGLTIEEIWDDATLQQWLALSILGFESTEEVGQTYYEAYSQSGFGNDHPWHHYIGWLHGSPVVIASLLLYAGVAGIYGVATHPDARRQGLGTAITAYLLQEIQKFGYQTAILAPSEMGINVYRKLGFQEYYTTDFYYWAPVNE